MAPKMLSLTVLVIFIAAAALVVQRAEAATHIVGGSSGWTNTVGANFYSSWASKQTFKVGDILEFDFTTGGHDVATLSKTAFEACNNTDLLTVPKSQGPANYTLSSTGHYYFICAFPGHCGMGQKLSIKVTAAGSSPAPAPESGSPSPSSSPSPPNTTTTTTAPPPSSASSLAATFSTFFVSIAIVLLV